MLKKPRVLNVGFRVFFGYYFSGLGRIRVGSKNVGFFRWVSGFRVHESITILECNFFK